MLEELAPADLRRVVITYRNALRSHQDELNRLNVYPVPDGDTGTNMALTLESVVGELDSADGMAEICHAVSHGSLMGARGNSGVILSQILRGLADTFSDHDEASAADLVAGFRRATDAAYQAVLRPVEGTILTVVRAATEAVEAAYESGEKSLAALLDRAAVAAREAVQRTPELLPVLKEAGVVDAGGQGFALMLDAFLAVVDGRPLPEPEVVTTPPSVEAHLHGDDASSLRYEVMYLLEAKDATIPAFKDTWASLGDSIVVVGGDGMWNCHVHTNDVGAAIEAGIEAGRPYRISVTPLAPVRPPAPVAGRRAVVAIVPGEGLAALFTGEGVRVVTCGPDGVAEDDVLAEIIACTAADVVVLPNDPALTALASRAAERARAEDRDVAVVPTRSPVQGLAAIAVADTGRRFGDDVIAMAEAAAATRWAEVTVADQEALTMAGRCQPGDALGSAEGDVVVIGPDLPTVAGELLDRLLSAGGELATLVVGPDAALGDAVCAHLSAAHPTVEVTRYEGAPAGVALLVGVE
jgi:hypothetical protein